LLPQQRACVVEYLLAYALDVLQCMLQGNLLAAANMWVCVAVHAAVCGAVGVAVCDAACVAVWAETSLLL